ncbi:MAG: DNA repair protein RecO [Firmicutes bacterium]|nr:DNA repair protein RecO [Bacillota bacterium]
MAGRNTLSVEGIVILSREYRDSDKSIIIFTKDRGRLSFVAKGARKLNSKNRSSTDLLVHGEYQLSKGKAYYVLNQGQVIEGFMNIRKDLLKTSVAMTMTVFLNDVLVDNMSQKEVFELLIWTFNRLGNTKDPKFLLRYFLIKSILYLGHQPNLVACNICNINSDNYFYQFSEGNLICDSCTKEGFCIEADLIKIYKILETDSFDQLKEFEVTKALLEKLDYFLEKLIEHITDKKFTGFDYLKKLTFEV